MRVLRERHEPARVACVCLMAISSSVAGLATIRFLVSLLNSCESSYWQQFGSPHRRSRWIIAISATGCLAKRPNFHQSGDGHVRGASRAQNPLKSRTNGPSTNPRRVNCWTHPSLHQQLPFRPPPAVPIRLRNEFSKSTTSPPSTMAAPLNVSQCLAQFQGKNVVAQAGSLSGRVVMTEAKNHGSHG